jgi:hypothetical protein
MALSSIFQWLDGRGWLVLSGGDTPHSDIRAQVLGRAKAEGRVAYIALDAPEDSEAMNDMADLGAPTGYMVDVLTENDDTIYNQLAEANVIVVEDTSAIDDLRSSLLGAAVAGMQAAYERSAIVLVEGDSTAVFGGWVLLESGETCEGLTWLQNALLLPKVTSVSESSVSRTVWAAHPRAIAIGIGAGSALALGPNGQIELWGQQQVTIVLGPAYQV